MEDTLEIHIVTDSTGDTAARVARAAQSQFEDIETELVRHARVNTREQLARALEAAAGRRAAVFYTLVDPGLREAVVELAREHRLVVLDVLGPALNAVSTASGTQAMQVPGRQAPLDAQYFRRIAAIEFAVKHDDGRGADDLQHADIVLVGVSRTSKTPTSMHLGYMGYMAANIPIVKGIDPPPALFPVEPWKIVGLTIDAERLAEIRRRRVRALAAGSERPLRRPGRDLRGARGDRHPAQAARLPGDRRDQACHRGGRGALRRAGRRTAPGRARGHAHARMTRYVYDFSQGSAEMRPLLGGKGANLAEMTPIGLPVPDGFTVTTEACVAYLDNDGRRPDGLDGELAEHLAALERRTGKRLGARHDPLLVSVRSGAVVSMPGMMDTILNLGMNDESVMGLAEAGGGERFAYDSYRRFVQMFGDVVAGVDGNLFENALGRIKMARGASADVDLDAEDLEQVVEEFREIYRRETGEEFPQDPPEQLDARDRRRVLVVEHAARADVPPRVPHRRRPRHGRQRRADGVRQHGRRLRHRRLLHPQPVHRRARAVRRVPGQRPGRGRGGRHPHAAAAGRAGVRDAGGVRRRSTAQMERLEHHYRDMQDIEFTIERGTLYMLQTRTGKRTAAAAV